jgi:hypothetical protein
MKINFFQHVCQKKSSEKKFGLYDAENTAPAIIKLDDEPSWNATVLNEACKHILFTAIDNCIDVFKDNGANG